MKQVISIFFVFLPFIAFCQQNVISGIITDENQELLIGAHIYSKSNKYTAISDNNGYFVLKIPDSIQVLYASYLGYQTDSCYISAAKSCDFALSTDSLPTIQITATAIQMNQIGKTALSSNQIKKIPVLLGEVDIIKAYTLLPGVSGTIEGSSGLIVRGGNSSQNKILMDGATIYNPVHLFGFISMFNPSIVNHVDLYKSGFTTNYDGRLSSFLNVYTKDGNPKEKSGEFNIGLINSSLSLEGPIIKDKLTYVLGGRLTNFGLLLAPTALLKRYDLLDQKFTYYVYDLNAKFNYRINNRQNLNLHLYTGSDNFKLDIDNNLSAEQGRSKVIWGNNLISVGHFYKINKKLTLNSDLNYTTYKINASSDYENFNEKYSSSFGTNSKVNDLTINSSLKWFQNSWLNASLGFETNFLSTKPYELFNVYKDSINNIKNIVPVKTDQAFVFSGFYQQHVNLTKKTFLKLGVRYNYYKNDNYEYKKFLPRFSLGRTFSNNQVIKVSYDQLNQFMHLNTSSSSGSPNEVWFLADATFPVEFSNQVSIGYSIPIPWIQSYFSLELYYKNLSNITRARFNNGDEALFETTFDWKENILKYGIGRAYGAEILVKKDVGKFSGWIGYTYSFSEIRFQGYNNNNFFPSDFNRLHDLELTGNYRFSKKWSLSSNFIFQSGRPITLPDASGLGIDGNTSFIFSSVNNYTTGPYHRLDMSITKSYTTKRNNDASVSVSVYNLYANNNPFSYTYSLSSNQNDPNIFKISIKEKSFLNFIPSINYSLKF